MSRHNGAAEEVARATAALVIGFTVADLGPVSPASVVAPAGPTG